MRPPSRLLSGLDGSARGLVADTWHFAHTHLTAIKRRSGEDYCCHGTEVALAIAELAHDAELMSTAILHDVLVHPKGENLLDRSPLSPSARTLVRTMHRLRRLHIDEDTRDLDLVLSAFSEDERLLPLRMAHRLNDIRHLKRFVPALQKEITRETLHMYTAIAGRLGMHAWRYEMEDICFPLLHPKAAEALSRQMEAMEPIDRACLRHARRFLEQKLRAAGLFCRLDERIKGVYSTYRKMLVKGRTFGELTDRLALRIIVPDREACYRVLGLVHAHLHPIPGKLKDYIGAPKENGYRSIHTVVYPLPGVTEQPIEIQIRTEDMHRECEYGLASHSDYKHYAYALQAGASRVHLLKNLESLREEARSPEQFEAALRTYFRDDHLAVFDAQNNIFHLKKPVTALDFVCSAYPKRWQKLKGVRINGRMQPLRTPLRDGDTVEALFGRESHARSEWIHQCAHRKARELIGKTLRQRRSETAQGQKSQSH